MEEATANKTGPNVHRILELYIPFELPGKIMRWQRWRVGKYNYGLTKHYITIEKPNVIFLWSQLRLTLGPAKAAQDSGIPIVYTFNDETIAGYRPARFGLTPKGLARYVVDNYIFSRINFKGLNFKYTTCISHMLKRNLLAKGLPIRKAKVIYQGIPLERFPQKSEPGKIKSPVRLLYVGQLHPYKGVHTLIEAAHLIADYKIWDSGSATRNVSVSIIGEGPEEYKTLLRDKAALGPANIKFTGKVAHAELPRIYREHDIFVFPSAWQEPFGLTHLEAMASGTPVISTAEGGHGEFLRDKKNALIFEKENPKQLVEKILCLLDDPDLSRSIAANARAMVEREFTLKRYVTNLETFLQETAMGENL